MAPGRGQKSPDRQPGVPERERELAQPSSPAGTATAGPAAPQQRPQDHPVGAALPCRRLRAGSTQVAQEVFNVIGGENGIVNSSTVTATGGAGRLRAVPAQRAERQPPADDDRAVRAALRERRLADRRHPGRQRPVREHASTSSPTRRRCGPRCSSSSRTPHPAADRQPERADPRRRGVDRQLTRPRCASLNHQINYSQITVYDQRRCGAGRAHTDSASRSARPRTTPVAC